MDDNNGLIAAYLLDGKGGGKPIGWDAIDTWEPNQGVLWIHLNFTHPQAQKWLAEKTGLDAIITESLTEEDIRPRCFEAQNGLAIFLRGVNLNPGAEPEDMVSIRVWIDKNRIISLRRRRLLSVDAIRHAIERNHGPKNPSHFISILTDHLVDRMADVISNVNDQVDDLEDQVLTQPTHTLRTQIADIRRQSIAIKRYLSPQRDALFRVQTESGRWLNKRDVLHLRETTDRLTRYIEDLESARERAAVTHEELSNKISEQLNLRLYLLSMVALIFIPLTFITGLLGINVGGIPGSDYKYAFMLITIGLLIVGILQLIFFKYKKWL